MPSPNARAASEAAADAVMHTGLQLRDYRARHHGKRMTATMTTRMQNVFSIGRKAVPPEPVAETMGFKACNPLAHMVRIGLPVPQAFVLGTAMRGTHRAHPQKFRERLRGLLESQMERPRSGMRPGVRRRA
ncbi:MAG: hypothetical protein IPH26_03515 [Sterolibacteriaceae bacterium]|uniref:Uncharacterized protein n=1 Tax=Candidatus Methylophosphatis roskildensis TaxID=2899263 RepID=A0A9D7E347_9PROT|nr:hypothetical protein [Candidatus Methylophosphatis roskildensis]